MKSLSCLLASPDLAELLFLVVATPHCYELSANTCQALISGASSERKEMVIVPLLSSMTTEEVLVPVYK